ncbi:MAG: cytochrome c family protein [Calditrichia bacterium]
MKKLIFLLSLLVFFQMGLSQDFKYIGSKKCKMCHSSKKSGEQFQLWEASSHAKAFETLASEESKKIAKEKGIADAQKAPECLKCHVTAYDAPAAQKTTLTMEEGVGCEACHGPGSEYKSMKVMKDVYAGKVNGATVGLITPDEKTCKKCHNPESPTYKEFNYAEMVKMIAHPVPKK